jgi:hypothetical protein
MALEEFAQMVLASPLAQHIGRGLQRMDAQRQSLLGSGAPAGRRVVSDWVAKNARKRCDLISSSIAHDTSALANKAMKLS